MASDHIGRRVSIGLGIEDPAAPGTVVAPQNWFKQLSADFHRKVTTIQNTSAIGRIEKVNDSQVVAEWAEGKLEGKVMDLSTGYLLTNMMGLAVTTTNADASGNVKDHTFDVANANVAQTLTIARKDPITDRRHGLATFSDLELDVVSGDWAKWSGSLMALFGNTASDTPAYAVENEFTSKHVTVKVAANVAGLGAATAIPVKSLKLKLQRKVTPYYPFGVIDPSAFNTGAWEASGEFVLRYTDTTYELVHYANTAQALLIQLKNTDVTIGTAANPCLAFTAPQARLNDWTPSNGLDDIVEQTVSFYCELSISSGYALRAVLTNLATGYVHP